GPIFFTTPAPSWPRIWTVSRKRNLWSVWQTPLALISTITSPAWGSPTWRDSTEKFPFPSVITARASIGRTSYPGWRNCAIDRRPPEYTDCRTCREVDRDPVRALRCPDSLLLPQSRSSRRRPADRAAGGARQVRAVRRRDPERRILRLRVRPRR